MSYGIRIERRALKELKHVPKVDRIRIELAIDSLADNPEAGGLLSGQWKGLRRLRVGSYRVIYAVEQNELIVLVVKIGHRKEVYRKA